jgi:hypothetical protein
MKKIILIFGLSVLHLATKAQEKVETMSAVEQFCTTPGRTITGYLIYRDSYGWAGTGVSALAMKYIDASAKDTAYGVTFSYYTNNTSGECSVYKYYDILVDFEEIDKVISWLEANQWIINGTDPSIGFLSYIPQKGNFELKLVRRINQTSSSYYSNFWYFVIQANKYDIDSEKSFSIEIKTVLENLKEFRRKIKSKA